VPQFVRPEAGPVLGQFLVFGAVLSVGGFVVNSAVGLFAGSAGRWLAGSAAAGRWLGRISGTIFAALALRLAILERA
ncbi:MAG: LysE family translocator, partial [Pseudodonghicola sp.]